MQCCSAQLTAISHAKKGVKDHGGKEQDDIMDASQGDTLDDTVVDDGTGRIRDSDGESSDSTEIRLCHHSPWASPLRQKSCDLIAAVQVIKHTSTEWTEHVSDSVLLDTSAEGRESPRPPVVPTDPLTESSTDPYWKDGDTEEFTARRIHGLGRRHAERNEDRSNIPLHEREGNREIKEEFTEFLKRTSSTTAATGSVTSTVSKYVGHIFSYPDSWLEFETVQKNELFKAKIHFAFGEPHFQLMSSPMGWVDHTGTVKDEAGRRMERLKAHAAFRRYLLDCIKRDKNKFGTDYAGLVTRGAIQNDIMDIGKTIDESGIWDSLHKMTEQQRQTKKAAVKRGQPRGGEQAKWCNRQMELIVCEARKDGFLRTTLGEMFGDVYQTDQKPVQRFLIICEVGAAQLEQRQGGSVRLFQQRLQGKESKVSAGYRGCCRGRNVLKNFPPHSGRSKHRCTAYKQP